MISSHILSLFSFAVLQCKTCSSTPMFAEIHESVNYFTWTNSSVTCSNQDPIPNLRQCGGYCNSMHRYEKTLSGKLSVQSTCKCCKPTRTISRTVKLTCNDGTIINKKYNLIKSCGCETCSGNGK